MDDLMDFDLKPAEYQTQLRVYNKEGEIFGVQPCACHAEPEEAIAFAEKKAVELKEFIAGGCTKWDDEEIYAADCVVETLVEVEGELSYEGTIWIQPIYLAERIETS